MEGIPRRWQQFTAREVVFSTGVLAYFLATYQLEVRTSIASRFAEMLIACTGYFDPGVLLFTGPWVVIALSSIACSMSIVNIFRRPVVIGSALANAIAVIAIRFGKFDSFESWSSIPYASLVLLALIFVLEITNAKKGCHFKLTTQLFVLLSTACAIGYILAVRISLDV